MDRSFRRYCLASIALTLLLFVPGLFAQSAPTFSQVIVFGDSLSDDEATRAQRSTAPAFLAVTSAFLLAELGDKTMLATITLAADNDWVGVWIGSTLGMVAADALAILVGAIAGKHLPEQLIQLTAAALFVVFGVFMLLDGFLPGLAGVAMVAISIGVVAVLGVLLRSLPERMRPAVMRPTPVTPTLDEEARGGARSPR